MLVELVLGLLTAVIALIAYAVYIVSINSEQYFKERNLKYKSFSFYNLYAILFGKLDIFEIIQGMYNDFPSET